MIANVTQTLLAIAIVAVVAVLIGFRPATGLVEWLAPGGLLTLITFGITWLGVALGMVAKGVGSDSNIGLPLLLLPFFGSGFVPTASMPEPLRAFAENQPFTSMIEAIRGLLLGTPVGNSVVRAVVWSIGFAVVGYLWAMRRYERPRAGEGRLVRRREARAPARPPSTGSPSASTVVGRAHEGCCSSVGSIFAFDAADHQPVAADDLVSGMWPEP